jgi:hypothetical protein
MSAIRSWIRAGIWLIPVYGVLTLYATWTHQPDPATQFRDWSEYVTTTNFLVGHILGSVVGTTLGLLGAVALGLFLADTRRSKAALAGLAATALGSGAVIATFGVAISAQPALGNAYLGGLAAAENLYDSVYGPATLAVAIAGVVLFSLGPILLGWAMVSSGRLPRWSGIAYGLSGPLIGIFGLVIGEAQTVGSVLLIGAGVVIARRVGEGAPAAPVTAGRVVQTGA